MILTGKALSSFNEWNYKDDYGYIDIEPTSLTVGFKDIDDYIQNYIIIEWLDSVGIYIEIGGLNLGQPEFHYNVQEEATLNGMNGRTYPTRQQATEAAIKEANEIYNSRK